MGIDRIHLFETDNASTLVIADKETARVIHSGLRAFMAEHFPVLGELVVDTEMRIGNLNREAVPITFPNKARDEHYAEPSAAIEFRPPLKTNELKLLCRLVMQHARPNDAGPDPVDHRQVPADERITTRSVWSS